jgi:vacuolar-type H+-ATPase subunit C/Vma6
MSADYGNARVAAWRGRLLDLTAFQRLAESASPAVLLAALGRDPEWRTVVRDVASLGGDPAAAIDVAIERHRAARLRALPPMFDGRERPLVEALVLSLDGERVMALLRRRYAGESPDTIGPTIIPGALLDAELLGRIARAVPLASAAALLGWAGLVSAVDQRLLAGTIDGPWPQTEQVLVEVLDRGRLRRTAGRSADARYVRALIEREVADRRQAATELAASGVATAALVERTATLARLDDVAAAGWVEPLGIQPVAAYVAAVDAEAIRLRVVVARVVAGWTAAMARPYLTRERRSWLGSSS